MRLTEATQALTDLELGAQIAATLDSIAGLEAHPETRSLMPNVMAFHCAILATLREECAKRGRDPETLRRHAADLGSMKRAM